MKPSTEFDIEITDIAYGGSGIGRHDGKVIFVPHALSGEIVRAKIVKERPSFTTAKNRCMSTRGCTGIYRYKLSWFPISTYYLGSGSILSAPSILKSYFRAYPMVGTAE